MGLSIWNRLGRSDMPRSLQCRIVSDIRIDTEEPVIPPCQEGHIV